MGKLFSRRFVVVLTTFLSLVAGVGCDLQFLLLPEPFPVPDIWYGVSTAAYQNEDSPAADDPYFFQTDWDLSYASGHIETSRGAGAYGYTEIEQYIAALKYLGVTHFRFGVEWARVEPRPDEINEAALEHYAHFARRLREENIEPIVCLWHWTFPDWLANLDDPSMHGWLNPTTAEHWKTHVARVVARLAPYAQYYAPQNEPNVQTLAGYVVAVFPPHASFRFDLNDRNVDASVAAFREAARIVREQYAVTAPPERPNPKIISIDNLAAWQNDPLDVLGLVSGYIKDQSYRHVDRVIDDVDIVGFTYYGRQISSIGGLTQREPREGDQYSDIGIEIYPAGLAAAIAETYERFGKPMLIVENGIADASDSRRPVYLKAHINAVRIALEQGYPILGYMHWSLVDNYEWQDGYGPKFGLFTLDSATRALVPRGSAEVYRELIAARGGHLP